jgi:electron transfer flavoprotein alpha subunit
MEVCRKKAIRTDAEPRKIPDFSDHRDVWVFAEQRDGELMRVSAELLGRAQTLAKHLEQKVVAVLLGDKVSSLAETLIEFGADTVYLVEDPALKHYRTQPYAKVFQELVAAHKPNILLMGATHIGRDLAPRVSRRVGSGLTADCTELSIDREEGILWQTRPAFGGNVMATIANRYSRPQMATVRPGVMEVIPTPGNKGTVVKHETVFAEEEFGSRIPKSRRKPRLK